MPGSLQAVELTTRYRRSLLALREQTSRTAASTWLALSQGDLEGSLTSWATSMTAVVEAAKRQGVMLADAYLATFVAVELGIAPTLQQLDVERYMDSITGRPLRQALIAPGFTVRAALSEGRSDALRLGLARATRTVAEEVLDAPRRALHDAMRAEDRVAGWRRVTGRNPCGACLALTGPDPSDVADELRRHGLCRCQAEPLVRGCVETYRRPTGREYFDSLAPEAQAALFHGRGGEEKADLIRSGAVPLEALATRTPQDSAPDQWSETPMRDLRPDPGPDTAPDTEEARRDAEHP